MPRILYSNYNCPHSLRAAFFLSEKGINFTRVEVDLSASEQKTEAYLAKNPHGTVPAYEDEQGVIGDSLEIMCYIDAQSSSPTFFPDDPNILSDALHWIDRGNKDFYDVSHHLYWQLIEPPAKGTDWSEVEKLMNKGFHLLSELEAILSEQEFLAGDFSVADIAIVPWVYGYRRFDLLDEKRFPHVIAWCNMLSQRASFTDNYRAKGIPFQEII